MPNVQMLRPGDAEESAVAWEMAIASKDHPVLMAFTRQAITVYEKADKDWRNTVRKGAYVVQEGSENPDITILATGSEVEMSLKAAALVPGKKIRVVSVMDKNLFEAQDDSFRAKIMGNPKRVVVAEAGVRQGWEGYAKKEDCFTIDRFGMSGPAAKVAEALGFTPECLAKVLAR